MADPLPSVPESLANASPREVRDDALGGWGFASCQGHLVEISGGASAATLTMALRLVREAQARDEPVAWITCSASHFYPPDAAEGGIDLDALIVIRLPVPGLAPRAADLLVRSGGFGLVALDLGRHARLSLPVQTRLAGLARKYGAAVLLLTEKSSDLPSLGPLISLRLETRRAGRAGGRFGCEVLALKDKRRARVPSPALRHTGEPEGRGPRPAHLEVYRGPDGLC